MNRPAKTALMSLAAAALLSGCTTYYPYGTPIAGATLDANRAPRGSVEFCETYARQSAANSYDTGRDTDSGSSYNAIQAFRAKRDGRRAYERCLAGDTR